MTVEPDKDRSRPSEGPPAPKTIGLEETRLWLMALYGATMIGIQRLEFSVSFLYLIGNHDSSKGSGSAQRQLRKALARLWESLNKGTAPMKLNDAKKEWAISSTRRPGRSWAGSLTVRGTVSHIGS